MNILIDFTQIPKKKVGVGVYALNTFTRLIEKHTDDCFYILRQDDDDDFLLNYRNVKILSLKSRYFRSFALRMLMEQVYIPYLCWKYNIDVVHSLHYSFPLFKTRAQRIVTIHDLTFFLFPTLHTFVKRYYFRWFTKRAAMNKSLRLICVSNSTREDLVKLIPDYKSSNFVAPLAFTPFSSDSADNIDLQKFGISQRYITFIGTLEPRKNIEGLIKAYYNSRAKERFQLVIVGKKGWYYDSIFRLVEDLDLSDRIIFTGFVNDNEKYCILKNSSIFIYPSFYEGFGLPVLEAMSLGIPVITSNISSMPEVGGDAVMYVNPNNVQEISEIIDSLSEDKDLQQRLNIAGISRSKNFSWDSTAELTYRVYDLSNSSNSALKK